jgi:hypothetical protein
MADLGLISAEINALPPELRPIFTRIFTAMLTDLRFGHPKGAQPDPLKNFGGGFFQGTTAAMADTEFTIAHGFGRTPYLAWPVLPLDQVGTRLVDLAVTRAADDKRIYLSSSVTDAALTLAIEG